MYHFERYRHWLSIEGEPLYYFAIAGRKNADVPSEFLASIGITTQQNREVFIDLLYNNKVLASVIRLNLLGHIWWRDGKGTCCFSSLDRLPESGKFKGHDSDIPGIRKPRHGGRGRALECPDERRSFSMDI